MTESPDPDRAEIQGDGLMILSSLAMIFLYLSHITALGFLDGGAAIEAGETKFIM